MNTSRVITTVTGFILAQATRICNRFVKYLSACRNHLDDWLTFLHTTDTCNNDSDLTHDLPAQVLVAATYAHPKGRSFVITQQFIAQPISQPFDLYP